MINNCLMFYANWKMETVMTIWKLNHPCASKQCHNFFVQHNTAWYIMTNLVKLICISFGFQSPLVNTLQMTIKKLNIPARLLLSNQVTYISPRSALQNRFRGDFKAAVQDWVWVRRVTYTIYSAIFPHGLNSIHSNKD